MFVKGNMTGGNAIDASRNVMSCNRVQERGAQFVNFLRLTGAPVSLFCVILGRGLDRSLHTNASFSQT